MIRFKAMETKEEWQWIRERALPLLCEDTQGIMAYDETGKIVAGVVMDSWTPVKCDVHWAIENPMAIRRGLIHETCKHVFITCGRKRMFGLVPDDKKKIARLDEKIGFYEVARIPDALRDGLGYIVYRMDKDNCRWIAEEHRKEAA